jgi:hypothetical protein
MKPMVWKTAKEFFECNEGVVIKDSVSNYFMSHKLSPERRIYSREMERKIDGKTFSVEVKETDILDDVNEYNETWYLDFVPHREGGLPAIIQDTRHRISSGKDFASNISDRATHGKIAFESGKQLDGSILSRGLWGEDKNVEHTGYDIAPYFAELYTSIMDKLPESKLAEWELPEDQFQAELWEYAKVYHQVVDDACKKDDGLPGVPTYETADKVAFYFIQQSQNEMVSLEKFKASTEKVVGKWMKLGSQKPENKFDFDIGNR